MSRSDEAFERVYAALQEIKDNDPSQENKKLSLKDLGGSFDAVYWTGVVL